MVGKSISHYRILEGVGAGGMGVVYKAEDTQLRRTVALKFLRPESVEDADLKARFEHEAQAIAALDHPNICSLYNIEEADGQTFLTMAYVDGQSLKEKIAERPLPLDEALEIAIQAGEGLQAAHEKGIVHRDIKSANIMLTASDQVKITDFGLAQIGERTRLTTTGATVGTPAYMSPEQAQRQTADQRSDIWSLGVVIYEMVTGRLPFEGDQESAVLYSIIHQWPEHITAVRVGVPTELDRIVDKALAKNPGERYQRVEEMLVDLRALRESPVKESAPVKSRRRTLIWALAGLAVVVLAVAIGLFLGGAPTTPIESIAVLPFENLTGDPDQEYIADGMTDIVTTKLSQIASLRVISRRSTMPYKSSDKSLAEIAGELNVDATLVGSVQLSDDNVRVEARLIEPVAEREIWTGNYDRDLTSVQALQSELARTVARAIRVELTPEEETRLGGGREVNPEIYEAYVRGKYYVAQNTEESFKKGLQYFHRAVEIDPTDPLAYAGLAEGYVTWGHTVAPRVERLRRAKAAALRALELDDSLVEAHAAMSEVKLYYDHDWKGAEEAFQYVLDQRPNHAMTRYHYAWYLVLFGRLEEAIAEHKRAQEIDPLNPLHTAWLGGLYWYGGRYEEAIAEVQKAVALAPNYARGYFILGHIYTDAGKYEEAIATWHKMIALGGRGYGLARTYAVAGRTEEAREILAQVPKTARWAHPLVVINAALGDLDEAFRWLKPGFDYPAPWMPWVRVGPQFKPLWDDPRFEAFLRSANLPPFDGFDKPIANEESSDS